MSQFAITAIDVKLANALDVDAFERAIYLAESLAPGALSETREQLYQQGLQSLLAQSGKASSELAFWVIDSSSVTGFDGLGLYDCQNFATLADALAQAAKLPSHIACALVAVNKLSNISEQAQQANISLDEAFVGYQKNEAMCALLLEHWQPGFGETNSYYVSIEAFAANSNASESCEKAIKKAGLSTCHIEQIELTACAQKTFADKEALAMDMAYQSAKPLSIALSAVASVVGDCGNAHALLSLLKSVLTVQQRFISATANWNKPSNDKLYNSPFYFPVHAQPWHLNPSQQKRFAAVNIFNASDNLHIVVADNSFDTARANGFLANSDLCLLPVAGKNVKQLLKKLKALQQGLPKEKSLKALAKACYQNHLKRRANEQLIAVLLACDLNELDKELTLALAGVEQAANEKGEWKTPKGSYFCAKPLGHDNNVGFLYPGIGATYVGLGRDLFHLFPQIFYEASQLAEDFADAVKDRTLNPRSIERLGFKELKQLDSNLRNHLPDIAECGVAFACIFTFVFQKVFGLKANFATGYSMGEVSMYAALGCWKNPSVMSQRLANSKAFNHGLTGELQTLRKHWDLPPAKPGVIEKLWETYSLKATVEQVQQASETEDRVYCTIVNTPDSLVIGGDPDACQRVIKRLGVRAMAMDMPNAIHSPPAFKEYPEMEALYTMDVTERIDTKLYSSSCYLPVPQRTKAIANSIAKCLCDPVDFPRLIETMHDKGADIFIEMGPGRSLSSWVEKILKTDKAHVSMPVNAKGTKDELTILRALAKLVSHGVNVDLNTLYYGSLLKTSPNNKA